MNLDCYQNYFAGSGVLTGNQYELSIENGMPVSICTLYDDSDCDQGLREAGTLLTKWTGMYKDGTDVLIVKYDGTVLWNGLKLSYTYDERTSTACLNGIRADGSPVWGTFSYNYTGMPQLEFTYTESKSQMRQTRRMYYCRMELPISENEKALSPMKFQFDSGLYPCVLCNGFYHEVHCLLRENEESETRFYLRSLPPQKSVTVFLPIGQMLEIWVNDSPISAYTIKGQYDCLKVGLDEEYKTNMPLWVEKNGYAYGSIRTMREVSSGAAGLKEQKMTFSIHQNTHYFMVKYENLLGQKDGRFSVMLTTPSGGSTKLEQMDTYMPYGNGKGGIFMAKECSIGQWEVCVQYDSDSEISVTAQVLPHLDKGSYESESYAVDELAVSALSEICDNALGRYYEFMLPFSMTDVSNASGNGRTAMSLAAGGWVYWCIGAMKTVVIPFVMAHPVGVAVGLGIFIAGVAVAVTRRTYEKNGIWNGIPYTGTNPSKSRVLFAEVLESYMDNVSLPDDATALLSKYAQDFYRELDRKKILYTIIKSNDVTNGNLKKIINNTKIKYISFKAHGMEQYVVPTIVGGAFSDDIWRSTKDVNLKDKIINFNCCNCGSELAKRVVKENGAAAAFGYAGPYKIKSLMNQDSRAYKAVADMVNTIDRALLIEKKFTFEATTSMMDKLYQYHSQLNTGIFHFEQDIFVHNFNMFCGPSEKEYPRLINEKKRTGSCSTEYGTKVKL